MTLTTPRPVFIAGLAVAVAMLGGWWVVPAVGLIGVAVVMS